jgi:uncharacterized protein
VNRNTTTMRWLFPLSMAFYNVVALAGDIACDSSQKVAERVICDHAILNRQYDRIYGQQQKLLDAGKVSTDQIASWRQERDACSDVSCVDVVFSKWRTIAAVAENDQTPSPSDVDGGRLKDAKNEPIQNTQQEAGSVEAATSGKKAETSKSVLSASVPPPRNSAEANDDGNSSHQLSNIQAVFFLVAVVLVVWGLSKIPPIRWVFKLIFLILGWAFSGNPNSGDSAKQNSSGNKKKERSCCVYCGSTSYGYCSQSPFKKHEHNGDEKKCVLCGSSSYGFCSNSPVKKHKHGSGAKKCRWCGSSSHGFCSHNPQRVHEH